MLLWILPPFMIFIKFGKAPQQDNTVQRLRFGLQPGSFGCVFASRERIGSVYEAENQRVREDREDRTGHSPVLPLLGRETGDTEPEEVLAYVLSSGVKRQSGANLGCGSEGAQTSSDDGKRQGVDSTVIEQYYMNKSGGIPNISRTSGSTPSRLCPVASLMRLQDTSTFWEGLVVNPARHPASMMSVRWN